MLEQCREPKDLPRKAKLIYEKYYISECNRIAHILKTAHSVNETSCQDMEKWEKRKVETKDYESVKLEEEKCWMLKEETQNKIALELMRSYIPPGIVGPGPGSGSGSKNLKNLKNSNTGTTIGIMHAAKVAGGCYSYELSQDLKNNKLTHWLCKHIDDIANTSFLTGESKQYFENIENLDLIECRALVYVLFPLKKFNNDADGKKWEWRNRLFNKTKSMIDQFNGIEIKGIWDYKQNTRSMVKLPPLKENKCRRVMYYFKTHKQYLLKLKQYDDKIGLLSKKEDWLMEAESAKNEAAIEWNCLLSELRDEQLALSVGVLTREQKDSLKRDALLQKTNTDRRYKQLIQEVSQLKRTIADTPLTRELYVQNKNDLHAYLVSRSTPTTSSTTTSTTADTPTTTTTSTTATTTTSTTTSTSAEIKSVGPDECSESDITDTNNADNTDDADNTVNTTTNSTITPTDAHTVDVIDYDTCVDPILVSIMHILYMSV